MSIVVDGADVVSLSVAGVAASSSSSRLVRSLGRVLGFLGFWVSSRRAGAACGRAAWVSPAGRLRAVWARVFFCLLLWVASLCCARAGPLARLVLAFSRLGAVLLGRGRRPSAAPALPRFPASVLVVSFFPGVAWGRGFLGFRVF